jgi:hypothetical protein
MVARSVDLKHNGLARLHNICIMFSMQQNRSEGQQKLKDLNSRFLEEIEAGKGWEDLKHIVEEMKEVAKGLDHMPAPVVSFDRYQLNRTGDPGT